MNNIHIPLTRETCVYLKVFYLKGPHLMVVSMDASKREPCESLNGYHDNVSFASI